MQSAKAGALNPSDGGEVGKKKWARVSFVFLPPLTCDLPNGAEHVEFLRIQRLNIVVDVPAGGKTELVKDGGAGKKKIK